MNQDLVFITSPDATSSRITLFVKTDHDVGSFSYIHIISSLEIGDSLSG
jgi:uncharacterized membrane protein